MFCKINIIISLYLIIISLSRCESNDKPPVDDIDLYLKLKDSNKIKGSDETNIEVPVDKGSSTNYVRYLKNVQKNCWKGLKVDQLFNNMNSLDKEYYKDRQAFSATIRQEDFKKGILKVIEKNSGKVQSDIQKSKGKAIPAGMNLGGRCLIKLDDSILILHRMKLCNSTRFKIDSLHSSLLDMTLKARLSLNDIVMEGTYERDMIKNVPFELYYRPTFNEVQLTLKNVKYEVEGRYRMLGKRLALDLIISNITLDTISMKYNIGMTTELTEAQIESYLDRLRVDLDTWLKNYFNDYYTSNPVSKGVPTKLLQYDKSKAKFLNFYMDSALMAMQERIRDLKAAAVKAPIIAIVVINGMKLNLTNGVLRGLDNMFRRSITTGRQDGDNVRRVDGIVGFNKLKLEYQYELRMSRTAPPLVGQLVMVVDELTALLSLHLYKEPASFDIKFSFLRNIKPETLLIQGADSVKGNFRHLFEKHVSAIMSNIIIDYINKLSNLHKCDLKLPGHVDPGEKI